MFCHDVLSGGMFCSLRFRIKIKARVKVFSPSGLSIKYSNSEEKTAYPRELDPAQSAIQKHILLTSKF